MEHMTIVQAAVEMHITYELRYVVPHALGQTHLVGDFSYKYDSEARRDARACDVAQLRECVNKRDDYRMPRWQTKEEVADPSIEYDEAGIGLSHQEAI